ncbi:MAG: hypothetical protein H6835_13455 [Planctomycetes bacterium]|nr:hypothetical protein [Planctomycetota bacterium]
MTRPLADPRVVLPALVAAVCFGFRAVPQRSPDEPVAAHSVALPPLRGLTPRGQVDYDLDPERSSVRFLVRGGAGQLLADCARVEGALSLGPEPVDGALTLRLDLASLRLRDTPPPTVDVHHVLGVLGDLQLEFRGALQAAAMVDVPGLSRDSWIGTVHFGPRVQRQPIVLWRTLLPGRPLRTQGHGTVAGASFGLPDRTWFGLFADDFQVTVGLDLAWRRRRGR